MKILSENSILNTLPAEIPKNEFLIFDAVRFSFEIMENNFKILENRLLDLTLNKKKEVSITFHYAWSIIDYTDRIRELLRQLPWEKPDEIIGNFKHLKDFRNTFQHLGNRKDKILKKRSPIFGVLSWFYKDLETNEFTPHTLVSGIQRGVDIKWTVPELKDSTKPINCILLRTLADGKLNSANLNMIMDDLRNLSLELENRIEALCEEKGLKKLNWEKQKDILIKFNHGKK